MAEKQVSITRRWADDSSYVPATTPNRLAPGAPIRHGHEGGLLHEHPGGALPHAHPRVTDKG